jgi:hypothetical protein
MNKFTSTVIFATFACVCSFGVVAGSHDDKNKETMRKDSSEYNSKQESYKEKSGSTSNKDGEMREKSLSERKSESSEQEVMNKKPYKQ